MNRIAIVAVVLGLAIGAQSLPAAGLIDFETTPAGGVPVDNAPLTTPYNIAGGGTVQFFFDTNGNNTFDAGIDDAPLFEAAGPDGSDAFTNSLLSLSDTAQAGFAGQLGNFFLRAASPGPPPAPFVIDYNTSQTINGLSGEIWDIDGANQATERWQVDVLDGANNLVTSLLSPLGNNQTLDGLPWTFSFTGLPAGVDKVRLTFIGTKTNGIGLAFNNFTPLTTVPEPSSYVLLALGGAGLLAARRRRVAARLRG